MGKSREVYLELYTLCAERLSITVPYVDYVNFMAGDKDYLKAIKRDLRYEKKDKELTKEVVVFRNNVIFMEVFDEQ